MTQNTSTNTTRTRKKMLHDQHKQAAITAKYGQRRKPAPVTIKTLDGALVRVIDQEKVGA